MSEQKQIQKNPCDLSLDQIWKHQLEMSGWIASEWIAGKEFDVSRWKKRWIQKNNFDISKFKANCFFCTYSLNKSNGSCTYCPGVLVDSSFSCYAENYNTDPTSFHEKLLALDKQRNEESRKDSS